MNFHVKPEEIPISKISATKITDMVLGKVFKMVLRVSPEKEMLLLTRKKKYKH